MPRIRTLMCAILLLTATVWAQSPDASDKETIQLLVQQVKELQAKVQALENSDFGMPRVEGRRSKEES